MTDYIVEGIENDIIDRLNKKERVYIESGSATDRIMSYSIRKSKMGLRQQYEEREVMFTTSACIFPEKIMLSDYDDVDCEVFEKIFIIRVR